MRPRRDTAADRSTPRHAAAALLLSFAAAPALGQPPPDCTAAEHRQFDFWTGRWTVHGPDGRVAGESLIEPVAGGCALLEHWSGRGGITGRSLNSWDRDTRRWHQHWVDSQGGLLRLEGAAEGAGMRLESCGPHPERTGALLLQRIVWTPQADGSVRQLWEQSDDGGRTWTVAFDGRYVRRP